MVTVVTIQLQKVFQLLKSERIKTKFYGTRGEGRSFIFGYIGMFYDIKHWDGSSVPILLMEYKNSIINDLVENHPWRFKPFLY